MTKESEFTNDELQAMARVVLDQFNADIKKEDDLVRQYLLGQLGASETRRIDELRLDPTYQECVDVIEDGLIEDHLEGNLSDEDNQRFLERYAATPEQRRKIRIFATMKKEAKEQGV